MFNLNRLLTFIAFGFGIGYVPWAPGTWGSFLAVLIYIFLLSKFSIATYYCFLIGSFIFGIYVCHVASIQTNTHDHKGIVWDEFVGMWFTLWLVPPDDTFFWIGIGFVLFRFFDIFKPWPVSWFDRNVKGGLGIMMDDLVAGLYAWLIIRVAILVLYASVG